MDWHNGSNWAATSGGPGGIGVPTSGDDVWFDGNGYVLCWPMTPIECRNMNLSGGMTEMLLINDGGIIYGDFWEQAGYCAPLGSVLEFKGNWWYSGGTFAAGVAGTGNASRCNFTGSPAFMKADGSSTANFQHFRMDGAYTMSGNLLTVAGIAREFECDGYMDIKTGNQMMHNDGEVVSVNGAVVGSGRWVAYEACIYPYDMTGFQNKYFQFYMPSINGSFLITPANWHTFPTIEFKYKNDNQRFLFGAGSRHYFNGPINVEGDYTTINDA